MATSLAQRAATKAAGSVQDTSTPIGYDAASDPYASVRFPGPADGVDRSDQPTYPNPYSMDYRDDVKDQYGVDPYAGIIPEIPSYESRGIWSSGRNTSPSSSTTTTTPSSGGGYGSGGASSVASALAGAGASSYQAGSYSPVSGSYSSQLDGAARAAIEKLLATPTDLSAEELAKTPENRAYRLGSQRSEERQRAQLAEEAAGEGWSDSGGWDTTMAGLRQQRGEGEATFLGDLANKKLEQNRAFLVQGIQFALSDGQFEKAQQLQAALANLDAELRIGDRNERGREFDLGLGFDYTQLGVNANQAAAQELMRF